MIESVVFSKPKMRTAPKKGGNPKYRLNTITYCKECYEQEKKDGKDERHNLGKFVGYDNRNGKNHKIYERYGCRKCRRSLNRDEVHNAVKSCFDAVNLSEDGRKRYIKSLKEAWKNEEGSTDNEIVRLKSELPHLKAGKSNLINALGRTSSRDVAEEIEKDIETKVEQIKSIETQIEELQEAKIDSRSDFFEFALKYSDELSVDFFDLPLEDVKVCEQLVFPGGFVIDKNKRVHTPKISPIYRYRKAKSAALTTDFTHLVGEESKTSQTFSDKEIQKINKEIDRRCELLNVKYIASKQNSPF